MLEVRPTYMQQFRDAASQPELADRLSGLTRLQSDVSEALIKHAREQESSAQATILPNLFAGIGLSAMVALGSSLVLPETKAIEVGVVAIFISYAGALINAQLPSTQKREAAKYIGKHAAEIIDLNEVQTAVVARMEEEFNGFDAWPSGKKAGTKGLGELVVAFPRIRDSVIRSALRGAASAPAAPAPAV